MEQEKKVKIIAPQEGGQERFVRSNVDVCFFGGSLGGGKLLSVNERVLTPQGWKRNGDLVVGDIVNTPFGHPSAIVAVFPHTNKDIYTLRTEDGRECLCGLEHLWSVRTKKQTQGNDKHNRLSVLTTDDIIRGMEQGETYYIPIPQAQSFAEKDFDITPYEMGFMVATQGTAIPQDYMFGSIRQRHELLRGLMDATGNNDINYNHCVFMAFGAALRDSFIELCRGLGYIATWDSGTDYNVYAITIYGEDINIHKRTRKITPEERFRLTHVAIQSITYKCNEDALCILIDHKDHLYIAGDYLTTHNTFGAILSMAEPALDSGFRGVFFRRTFGELKAAGGVVDLFKEAYGDIIHVKISDNPRFTFSNGSFIEARQINNEDPKQITEIFRGLQADCLTFEELTTFDWYTFMYIMSRARGRAKWTGKVRATLNPKRSHWTRKWLDWWIGPDGFPIKERDGVVRYFFLRGDKVEDLVWGDTKEEVYLQCKPTIDRQMSKLGGDITYEDLIKSFTFYRGTLTENKALLENNRGYVGNVAAVGERMAQALIEGNFNIDIEEDEKIPIPYSLAESVFMNDPQENNDLWVTADLADTGTDNTVIFVWNGLHIIDYVVLCTSTPRLNAEKLKFMAEKWDIPDSHIIYDGIRAVYVNDYIPSAQPFISYRPSFGKYGRAYKSLKDECFARLVNVIKRRNLSFTDKIANSTYAHLAMTQILTIKAEFIEECSVVRFKTLPGGRQTLLTKKEMNQKLGKGRSMDILDPIAMRMMPLLGYEYGMELILTAADRPETRQHYGNSVNIYSDSTWC